MKYEKERGKVGIMYEGIVNKGKEEETDWRIAVSIYI